MTRYMYFNKSTKMIANRKLLYFGAAACSGIAGILHLIATEVFQIAYIGMTAVIIAKERVGKPQMIKEKS